MSTIAEKLIRLHQTKADIKAAIETKGQTVGGMEFSQYANKIRAIKGLSPVTPSSASVTDVTGKLNRLAGTKADIKTAIEACGVPVGSIPFSLYADKIRAIQTKLTYTGRYGIYLSGEVGVLELTIDEVYSPNGNFIIDHEDYNIVEGTYTCNKNEDLELHVTIYNYDGLSSHSVNGHIIEPFDSWTFLEVFGLSDNQIIQVTYNCEW